MRPKSEIYTPKRDEEHPCPFHMGVPSPPGEAPHVPFHNVLRGQELQEGELLHCKIICPTKVMWITHRAVIIF